MLSPPTRRGLSGLRALLGIGPTAAAVGATSTSSPAANIANAIPAPAREPTIEPAWDPLTDPLIVVRELQWLQHAVHYLLVARLRDRSGSDPLPDGPLTLTEVAEFSECDPEGIPREHARRVSDREQVDDELRWMQVCWARLTDLQWRYERPIFEGSPEVRARIRLPDEE